MQEKFIGFHASHELYSPSELLELVRLAEKWDFTAASCSDHFHPWVPRGHSGFAFSWLGAALEATSLPFTSVHAPGQRYHPAISAQAAATLAEMYPGRYDISLGSGENLNENITGDAWPEKAARNQRLLECADVMRALWRGEEVTHEGLVRVERAKLYTRPEIPPRIIGAAISVETARWLGSWADALITVGRNHSDLKKTIAAFREGGGEGKPVYLQSTISYGRTDDEAAATALRRWPIVGFSLSDLSDLPHPDDFERGAQGASLAQAHDCFRISADLEQHREWLRQDFACGIDGVYLHYLGDNIDAMIKLFGMEVLAKVL